MGRRFGSKLGYALLQAVADGVEIVELANRKPGALSAYGLEELRCLEAMRVRRKLLNVRWRLQNDGLIEKVKGKGADYYRLTDSGNVRLKAQISKPPRLPPGWRTIISFDIPEDQKKIRNRFRRYLRRLDFKPMQQSVWYSDRAWTSRLDGNHPKSLDLSWVVVFRAEQLK